MQRPLVRRTAYAAAAVFGLVILGLGGLWWRLSSGPIELDMATPWLTAAIEQNFGSSHRVEVGGTQIERENGHTALRLRDIVVRDADGTIVASAPKAEIGISPTSLLTGHIRAESLNLVGAELAVRIETDGRLTVFAGADKRPIATTAIVRPPSPPPAPGTVPDATPGAAAAPAARGAVADFAAMLLWIDSLGASGLDGYDLSEIGLKSGNLKVDDQRSGKQWNFIKINLSLMRQKGGGISLRVGSLNTEHLWELVATVTPKSGGAREVSLEADKVSTRDLLLALRIGEGEFEANLPISASIRGEIAADGTPITLAGRILAEPGYITDISAHPARIDLDRVEIALDWDIRRGSLQIPHLHIVSGTNRATLMAQLEAPQASSTAWSLALGGGTIVLTGGNSDENPLVINRINVRARFDSANKRIDLDQADFSSIDLGLAISGHLDASGAEPWATVGVAGTKMSMTALKRMWPAFIATGVRNWVMDHVWGGNVERFVVAANAPLSNFREDGPPMPEEGLSVELETSATTLRPVDNLPPIRDADLNVRITGRSTSIAVGRGTLDVSAARKLNLSGGLFEIGDTHQKPPQARTRFRLDGSLAAVAELLAMDTLRDDAGFPLDPASSRGTVAAQVMVSLPITSHPPKSSVIYSITGDINNFVADKAMLGQRVEAAVLHATGNAQGYQIKGDVKIGGTPASLEYRKVRGEPDAEVRLQTTLDESARNRLGIDFGSTVSGSVPVKLTGRVDGGNDADSRFNAELDLTAAKIDNLLPGWVKPAGRAARATFTMVKDKTTRFDDLAIDGQGTVARGSVELDANGDLLSANFPVFAMSDGDKLTLKADRGTDNVIRVAMRGDVYDGHNFIKASMAGVDPKAKRKQPDVDLDVKIGAVAGFHGETLRALDLKLSRRGGRIRSFALSARIGRDAPLIGDLRVRTTNGRQVIYLETADAGALFRLTDVYPHINGGKLWVAMDPPTAEGTPQDGILNIQNFSIRGESGLDPVLASAPGNVRSANNIDFTQMRVEFTRTAGRTTLRDGVVRGPVIGATIDGNIDYTRDEVLLRGTLVPLYGLNNMFGQIPIVGMFLGAGDKEGLFGITYEVNGPPGNTRIKVNPISAIAPGIFRKLFEFRDFNDRNVAEPTR